MRACFLGGTRYSQPLDATSAKKFRALESLGELFVIGFSQDLWPRKFTEHSHFYLLPRLPLPVLRYAEVFIVGPLLILWCILRHEVLILVAQGPYEGFAAAWAKILARLFGRRVALIVESHGDFEISLFLQRRVIMPEVYRSLMRRVACFSLRHADALRCVSNSTREQLEPWASGKPIVQFPTWTDIELFLNASACDGRNDERKIILCAGVLIPRKGVDILLTAFPEVVKEIPAAKLWVIGKADEFEYGESLKNQVKKLGLDASVSFMGEMSQDNLAEHMAKADVFVLPTQSEGLPRVVFESMAAGTPVIASAVSGIPEIIEDGATGFLVPSGNVATLAERLRWMLQHPEETREMGQRAREFARRFFSREGYVQNYARLFELACQVGESHAR